MNVDDVPAPGRSVETVDVLSEHPHTIQRLLYLGDYLVSAIVLGTATCLFNLRQVFPGQVRRSLHHLARQQIFDWQAFLSRLLIV